MRDTYSITLRLDVGLWPDQYKSSCLLDATIVFLEQNDNHINLLVQFTKHRQLARQVGDSLALSIVEKEAMAHRTTSGCAHRMAHGGHIRHENYEFISAKGPVLASALSRGPDLHPGGLDPMVHSEHTLKTTLICCILEFERSSLVLVN